MSRTMVNSTTAFVPTESSNAQEAIERILLTELVRGQDGDLYARLAPVVRRQHLILDLELVERIDAAGIAALISLYRCASDAGFRFAVTNPSSHVAEIIAVVGLERILVSRNADRVPQASPGLRRSAA